MFQSRNQNTGRFRPKDPAAAIRLETVMDIDAGVQDAISSINLVQLHAQQDSTMAPLVPHIEAAQHNLVAVHFHLRTEAAQLDSQLTPDWLRKAA